MFFNFKSTSLSEAVRFKVSFYCKLQVLVAARSFHFFQNPLEKHPLIMITDVYFLFKDNEENIFV